MSYIIPDYIQITETSERYVLLDCRDNFFYGISKTGGELLEQIYKHGDFEEAVQLLSSSYHVPLEKIEQDMMLFLDHFRKKGWVIKT